MTTPEQQAREMLGRMKVEHADYYSAGDLIELANLIAKCDALKAELDAIKRAGEPVAWLSPGGDVSRSKKYFEEMGFTNLQPLYTHPATPLTGEQVEGLLEEFDPQFQGEWPMTVIAFARAIEAAHNIKGAKG